MGKPHNVKVQGYTLVELLIAIFGVGVLCLAGFAIYALIHFIAKFW